MRTAVNVLAGIGALFLFAHAFALTIWLLFMREQRRQQRAETDRDIERILAEGDPRG